MVDYIPVRYFSPGMIRRKVSSPEAGANTQSPKIVGDDGSPFQRMRAKQSSVTKVRINVFYILAAIVVTIAACQVLRRLTAHNDPATPNITTLSSASHAMTLQSTGQMLLERFPPVTVQLLEGAKGSNAYDQVRQILPAKENENSWLGEEWANADCVPMHKWQLPKYSPFSCNLMHEMDMADVSKSGLTLINCGGSRCAFEIIDVHGIPMVVKTPKFYSDYYSGTYDEAWLDTIVMERLYSSPFVLDIYGNCGVAQLTELSKGGNLHDLIKIARQHGDRMSPENKLRIGYQVATAVGDLHSIDGDMPSVTHNDLCCHQFILIDGVYKLNDFHLAGTLKKDRQGNACLDSPKGMNRNLDKTRAPEELKRNGPIHRDKADVWIMGNILYYVLTKKWLFEGIPTKDARQMLIDGKLSSIPSEFLNSTNSADLAMIKAIQMAWVYNPDNRPTAREIASFLKRHLLDDTWRVDIPPLPPNHRYTDSDFYRNLKL